MLAHGGDVFRVGLLQALLCHPLYQRVGKPRRTGRTLPQLNPHPGRSPAGQGKTDGRPRASPQRWLGRLPPLTSAKKAVVVILWLSKTPLSVGTRFFTIRGSRGPACRAIALPREAARVTRAGGYGWPLDAGGGGCSEQAGEPLRPGFCEPPATDPRTVGCHDVPLPGAVTSRAAGPAAAAHGAPSAVSGSGSTGSQSGSAGSSRPRIDGSRRRCPSFAPAHPAAVQNRHVDVQDRKAGGPGLASSPPATHSPGDEAQGRTEPTPGARRAPWREPAPADLSQEGWFLFWTRHSQVFGRFKKAFLQILENPKPLVSSAAVQELLSALGGGTAKSPAEPGSAELDRGLRPSLGLTASRQTRRRWHEVAQPPREGRAAASQPSTGIGCHCNTR